MSETHRGQCLCGAVKFNVAGPLKDVSACHCGQCRQWSGHYWASVNSALDDLEILDAEDSLRWYRASDFARRGFCGVCGSSLFWHADGLDEHKDRIAIAAGALERPTGLKTGEHIFLESKGDYYELPEDGATRFDTD